MGVAKGKGGGVVGCNRLVTSYTRPIPVSIESRRGCFQFLVRRILDGSGW